MSLCLLPLLLGNCANDDDNPAPPKVASLQLLTDLNDVVNESSGLIESENRLLSHNDSDGATKLYQLHEQSPTIERDWHILGAENIDWEDLAKDDQHLYIADMGNNFGIRPHLDIYQLLISDFDQDSLNAQRIRFTYPDQINFESRPYQHNFNGEALIAFGDSLYVFTKNHLDKMTKVYAIAKEAGQHEARFCRTFNTEGLITAAAMDEARKVLCLLGYNQEHELAPYRPFLWLFYNFVDADFFGGEQIRLEIELNEQMEGLCFSGDRQLLISSETENGQSAHLFRFDAREWIP